MQQKHYEQHIRPLKSAVCSSSKSEGNPTRRVFRGEVRSIVGLRMPLAPGGCFFWEEAFGSCDRLYFSRTPSAAPACAVV